MRSLTGVLLILIYGKRFSKSSAKISEKVVFKIPAGWVFKLLLLKYICLGARKSKLE